MAPILYNKAPQLRPSDFTENVILSGLMICMLVTVLKIKFKWFRARLKFDNTREPVPTTVTGVYRQTIDSEQFDNNRPTSSNDVAGHESVPFISTPIAKTQPNSSSVKNYKQSYLTENAMYDDAISKKEIRSKNSDPEPDYINEISYSAKPPIEVEYLTLTDEIEVFPNNSNDSKNISTANLSDTPLDTMIISPKYQKSVNRTLEEPSTHREEKFEDYDIAVNPKYQTMAMKRNSDFMVNRNDSREEQEYSNTAASIFLRRGNQTKPKKINGAAKSSQHYSPKPVYTEPRSRPLTLASNDTDNLSISSQTSA